MAQLTRTIDLLPEIFRTEPNRKFLASTLDQLSRNAEFERVQGFIGRANAPGFSISDNYVDELSSDRRNYQLEPGVVFTETDSDQAVDAITYVGILDALSNNGANIENHDRLFKAEYATWDPFIDFDKFSNFNRYYWLPAGPDSVDVSATEIPFTDDFDFERRSTAYDVQGFADENPVLTLVRGGTYTFNINQPGSAFWIQTSPGTDGVLSDSRNRTSRDVLGVVNNGSETGEIIFNVPDRNAQSFFYNLGSVTAVDLLTDIGFDEIHNKYVDNFVAEYGGIDGVEDLDGKTVVITRPADDSSWNRTSFFDGALFDQEVWDQTTKITAISEIAGVWKISIVAGDDGRDYLSLSSEREIPLLNKFSVTLGTKNANRSFYRDAQSEIKEIPLLSAIKDTLYYQDAENPDLFGRIILVEQEERGILNVDDIIGRENYTSPNGVRFTNGLKVQFRGLAQPSEFVDKEFFVEGVGTAIQLLPVEDFITPETYTNSETIRFDQLPFDVGNFEESLNQPQEQDYFVINRASPDLNPWSRTNRWFHEDVIRDTAKYNNSTPAIDNLQKAKRPILEFRAGLRLFNFGTRLLDVVDVIDFRQDDAFSNVNGSIGYSIDGVTLLNGTKIIFANDTDNRVKNKIYEVSIRDPNDDGIPQIILNETTPEVALDSVVVVQSGVQNQGKSFRYDGNGWVPTQQKTKLNQPPLFDVFDSDDVSFGDQTKYAGSNFTGSKLFSYAEGNGPEDDVLGFSLKFLTINNVGDIVYNNDFYTDKFTSVDGRTSRVTEVKSGFVREYTRENQYQRRIGWQKAISTSRPRQAFRFLYQRGKNLFLDIPAIEDGKVPSVKIMENSEFVPPSRYQVTVDSGNTRIRFTQEPENNAIIDVFVLSDSNSQFGFYQIPDNLEKNPFNEEPDTVTLGTIRNHYQTLLQNVPQLIGQVNGSNNSRDLGNIIPFGTNIVQHSSSLIPAATVLRSDKMEFFKAIEFNARAYETYKTRIIDAVTNRDFGNDNAREILDTIVSEIASEKSQQSAFFWSDMLPSGLDFVDSNITISEISGNSFDTVNTYDFSSANLQSLLVYVNDVILIKDEHYVVSSDSPKITITAPLSIGDKVCIREYTKTNVSFVPNTPTKMGLYPAYVPEKFFDDTFVEGTDVIRGHDGSITVAYGDIRDDVLLELETRIYNNIKVSTPPPLLESDVVPGKFRTTDYDLKTINEILSVDFLTWSGSNRLDYKQQTYNSENKFTWNYSTSNDRIGESDLAGHWRGIYRDFYDTDSPHTRPWEMLGFSKKPTWWDETYGPSPYTKDNLILWTDLADGRVKDPDGEYIIESRVRSELLNVIPVDSHGNLLPPLETVVKNYSIQDTRKSWVFGDGAPVENAWRRSSTYPYVVQKLLALTRPAEYFATAADRDRYVYSPEFEQYLYDSRGRLDIRDLGGYGQGNARHSYFNWITDYDQQIGETDRDCVSDCFSNVDVRLCHRLGGFTDKRYFKLFAENFTPDTQNSSLLIPDESYQLLFYRNEPNVTIRFSPVIIQVSEDGWTVWGNSNVRPYFEITESLPNGNFSSITVGQQTVRYSRDFKSTITRVPYGYTFRSREAVVDFLISYGRELESRGMKFESTIGGVVYDWVQIAREFLNWSQQGWGVGNIINLNPSAETVVVERNTGILEDMSSDPKLILNQNRRPIRQNDYSVDRDGDKTEISVLSDDIVGLVELNFVNYEQLLILDNKSIFSDLLYDPASGNRQNRLLFSGSKTSNWSGRPDAPGFLITNSKIDEWQPNKKYARGEIVRFKNQLFSANELIEPSEEFDQSRWVFSNFDDSREGLLPNISTKAESALDFFNKNSANLNDDADLLGLGITGFRPRQYLENLNLDDITQANLYSSFISSKGTPPSLNLLSNANFGKEKAEYNVFENWAVKQGSYGANGNRSFFEIFLDQELLQANPALLSIVDERNDSDADQMVRVDQLYKESKKFTDANVLPVLSKNKPDFALPTAGYVNADMVDLQVFSLEDLVNQIDVTTVSPGFTIWVAKDGEFDWNVYYVGNLTTQVTQIDDNLNGQSRVTFSSIHGLRVGDKIIIEFFSNLVDGFYEVLETPSLNTVLINYSVPGSQTQITGNGVALLLESSRVKQPSDIIDLGFAISLETGDRVWVDNDGTGKWQVLEKQQPFDIDRTIEPEIPTEKFGTSIAQGFKNSGMIVGAPTGGTSSQGEVFLYNLRQDGEYVFSNTMTLFTPNTEGYGSSVSAGNSSWGVVGAPESNDSRGYASIIFKDGMSDINFQQTQLLLDPASESGDRFGHSVVISEDGRWIYVSAPGANVVYAYARSDREQQFVELTADGESTEYFFGDEIRIGSNNSGDELSVIVNNKILSRTAGDYSVNTSQGIVSFAGAPSSGSSILIARKEQISLNYRTVADGIKTSFNIASLGIIDDTKVEVYVDETEQTLGTDYTIFGQTLSFASAPSSESKITVFNPELNQLVGVDDDIDSFTLLSDGVILRKEIDYTFDDVEKTVDVLGGISAVVDADILVRARTQFRLQTVIGIDNHVAEYESHDGNVITLDDVDGIIPQMVLSGTGFADGQYVVSVDTEENTVTLNAPPSSTPDGEIEFSLVNFGSSLDTTTDGRQLTVGCVGNSKTPGQVFVFDRIVERFEITDTDTDVYTPRRDASLVNKNVVPVRLNHEFLIPDTINSIKQYNLNGNYSVLSNADIDVSSVEREVGDFLEIETSDFILLQTLTASEPTAGSEFGFSVSQCPSNCSLYIGSPKDSRQVENGGSVERYLNTYRVYGLATSGNVDVTLTPGDTVRVDNVDVEVSDVSEHVSGAPHTEGDFRLSDSKIYRALQDVPPGISIEDTDFWELSSWIAVFAQDINNANIVNVQAMVDFRGALIITAAEPRAQIELNKLSVLPGDGNAFFDLGFSPISLAQTILPPRPVTSAMFGYAVQIESGSTSLVVGSPGARLITPSIWATEANLEFDGGATKFIDTVDEAGLVETFDLLPSATDDPSNPGNFVFGQQIFVNEISTGDKFGTGFSYVNGRLIVGASNRDTGLVYSFTNVDRSPAWRVIDQEATEANSNLINSVYVYDSTENRILDYLDWIDPLQGKILGVAKENIDFITPIDPAGYNQGENVSSFSSWRDDQVGKIWWDVSNYRLSEYHSNDIIYSSKKWGQMVDGSRVEIYQWIESSVPPSRYSGPGIPKDVENFTAVRGIFDEQINVVKYYFWVTGTDEVFRTRGKTLGINSIRQYIESPISSGISHIAPISPNTVGLYNCGDFVNRSDSVLHVEFDQEETQNQVHVEYQLISENRTDDFITGQIYRKLVDSLSGADSDGNLVPDVMLPPSELYGVDFRPRQSMFISRENALQNYISQVNRVLLTTPILETHDISKLNSEDAPPIPSSGKWDKQVESITELGFQNLEIVPAGYRYLVLDDETIGGLWSIYELSDRRELNRVQVQTFKTQQYWRTEDWYAEGYSSRSFLHKTVDTKSDLFALVSNDGDLVRVDNAGAGQWEIYARNDSEWVRVAAQSSTLQFNDSLYDINAGRFGFDNEVFDAQFYDERPVQETRQIVDAINEDLLTGDLGIERNRALVLLFNYILSEQIAPEWIQKTSLIDVDHIIRSLDPFKVYQQDNQTFIADYINEVKPYHVKIRQFNLKYQGTETYLGDVTDFDVPAEWNSEQDRFISPVLDETGRLSSTSSIGEDSDIWTSYDYQEWFDNRLLIIDEVSVFDGGSGYVIPPEIKIIGNAEIPATARARINVFGEVSRVEIVDSGSGYTETPTIEIIGGGGSGARVFPVMETQGTRSPRITLRYDRHEYTSNVRKWEQNTFYATGDLVRYEDEVYRVLDISDSSVLFSGEEFLLENYERVPAGELSGIDRTAGYYIPATRTVGSDEALLIGGISYPGVQVDAPNFNENTGFDISSFDNTPFDNIDEGPENQTSVQYISDGSTTSYALGYPDDGLPTTIVSTVVTVDGVEQTQDDDYEINALVSNDVASVDFFVAPPENSEILIEAVVTRPTYSENILDVDYSSNFGDSFLGTLPSPEYGGAPTDSREYGTIVDGGKFIDTYSSHAPEELVPGSIFDTLDITVTTRSGFDNAGDGHAWETSQTNFEVGDSTTERIYEIPQTTSPATAIVVTNATAGRTLPSSAYEVDWVGGRVKIISGVSAGNVIRIEAFGLGGGNQLHAESFVSTNIFDNTIPLPVSFEEIEEILIFVDGQKYETFGIEETQIGSKIELQSSIEEDSLITVFVLGETEDGFGASYPLTQAFQYDGSTRQFELADSLLFSNKSHAIVEVNGLRLRPPNGIHHVADESTLEYDVSRPDDSIQPGQIGPIDVAVYINDEELNLNSDFVLSPSDGSSIRTISLINPPNNGDRISIYVRTLSDYVISAGLLTLRNSVDLSSGDEVTIRTWRDLREQRLQTKVFQGPTGVLSSSVIPYDSRPYDSDDYDEVTDSSEFVTEFPLGNSGIFANRLWVTYNGERLLPNEDYIITEKNGEDFLIVTRVNAAAEDIIAVTIYGQSVVPTSMKFKIFDDMRENKTVYRIIDSSSTKLSQPLGISDDIIYLENAGVLEDPELVQGRFGILFVNGERITFRNRDLINNTVSGLRRGTAGTAALNHDVLSIVVDGSDANKIDNGISTTWYDLGENTILSGSSLQRSGNEIARFLRGE